MSNQAQGFDFVIFIKILYKNIILILITAAIVTGLVFIATMNNKKFKTEFNL